MVFALETYWPAADGWSAARIEEEVVVTADGCEVITKFPAEELLVAGQRYWTVGGQLPTLRESQSHLNTMRRAGARRDGFRGGVARRSTSGRAARVVRADGGHPADREGGLRPVHVRPGQGHHPPCRRARGRRGRRQRGPAPGRLRVRHLPRPPPRDGPRCHAEECLAELMSKATGLCKAKGGSMHLTKADRGMLGSYAIVGAHLPIAAGAAWSAKLRGTDQVAVAFFGDGATNIGAFHEALNLAAVWKLPVLFVCENNLYMEYTPIAAVTSVPNPAADRAAAYGIAGR